MLSVVVALECTYQQVADELGFTSRGTAHNVVAKALREQTAAAVGSLRSLENADWTPYNVPSGMRR